MSEKLEYKFIQEVKAAKDENDGKMRFEGYLAYFDNVDSYGDVIEKGAFKATLRQTQKEGKTIPVLEQHGWLGANGYTPIGYYENLKEDSSGLYAEGVLFGNTAGKDMYTLLKEAPAGAMGQSIGYRTLKQRIPSEEEARKTGVYRYLEELKLLEGSIVTFPANDKTRVEHVKAASMFWRQLEEHFRKGGFSKEQAKKAVSLVKSSTPDESFAQYLSQCGFIDNDEKACGGGCDDRPADMDKAGADKLLEALRSVKLASDMDRLRSALKGFSLN